MKTLIVYAHPEPQSLNNSLKDLAVSTLENAGHEVRVSDLYAMNWKAVVDASDYGPHASNPLRVARDSGRAFDAGTLTPDVRAEQEKLLWADTIIFQFPLWWYTMPAILKGWVDRVFTFHFAYGVGEHSDTKYGERFGEGTLAGRRALLSVTAGGPQSHYSARGINGPIDDLLFPIHHGILYYPGSRSCPRSSCTAPTGSPTSSTRTSPRPGSSVCSPWSRPNRSRSARRTSVTTKSPPST